MKPLIAVPIDDDTTVLFEVADPDAMIVAGREGVTATAGETLRSMLDRLRPVLDTLTEQLHQLPRRPDRYTVELGVTVTAESGMVIAKAASDAHFTLTLEWSRPA
ncbi:MAG TPA: CU044_2847 family protein [Planosporangium sp.]|jgi:hypothetical protein|nr:CU044_2847 family protein [Planosporangium sp.]